MRSNKVEYSTADGVYCTMNDVKVSFCMPKCSGINITNHCFHVNNKKCVSYIVYAIIIVRDLMVQLSLEDDFKHQFLQCDGDTVHMKEPISLLGKSDITKRKMHEVIIQTKGPASTREATKQTVKILNSTYEKVDLKKVAKNATKLNA